MRSTPALCRFSRRAAQTFWLLAQAKLVHPDFVQDIGKHWRSRSLRWNALDAYSSLIP